MEQRKKDDILRLLSNIEKRNNITILHAVIVGSRQFCLENKNSDWDIRFVYKDNIDWYFKSNDQKYSYEGKVGDIDWHGVCLSRAVEFVIKSNGSFIEWMCSDLILKSNERWFSEFKEFLVKFANERRIHNFYHSIGKEAKINIEQNGFHHKLFFIYLRSLLSIKYNKNVFAKPNCVDNLVMLSNLPSREKEIILRLIDGYKRGKAVSITTNEFNIINLLLNEMYLKSSIDMTTRVTIPYIDPTEIETFHMKTILS